MATSSVCPASSSTGTCPVVHDGSDSNGTANGTNGDPHNGDPHNGGAHNGAAHSGTASNDNAAAHNEKGHQDALDEAETEALRPIPQPRTRPIIRNLGELDPKQGIASLMRLRSLYGPIYQLKLIDTLAIVSSEKLVNHISDESLFQKYISNPLKQVRHFAGDGLFTAYGDEHNWHLAHRILVPAFGPLAIKKMQPMMLDIIAQMVMTWENHAGEAFEAAEQFTNLAFDTIGWCAFRTSFQCTSRFNTSESHPFIESMVKLLSESGARARRPGVLNSALFLSDREFHADIARMHKECDEIVAERRKHPDPDANDLLNRMILDKDPRTGEHLSDDNIRYQMVTFLIAGHETTSAALSFAMYYMLKNPRTFVKAREEADRAIEEAGGSLLQLQPNKLSYIDAILKEALRLQPTAPAWAVSPKAPEGAVLPGGYHVKHGQPIVALLAGLHRDVEVWGKDAEEFRPERWLDGTTIPTNAWKPFGNGDRACIGRGFAMQEAQLAVAIIVNRFDLSMADPGYDLTIKETLTVKPDQFKIIARKRNPNQSLLTELIAGGSAQPKAVVAKRDTAATSNGGNAGSTSNLYIYYGSNSGSCSGLAVDIASLAPTKGYNATVGELDSVAGGGKLPADGPVVIITASYEGKPTDNARMFVESLAAMQGTDALKGVKYIVMGAGHRDWAQTFHKMPKYIHGRLADLGAEPLLPLSLADAGGDLLGDFEAFQDRLWGYLKEGNNDTAGNATPTVEVTKEATGKARVLPSTANPAWLRISCGIDGVGKILSQDVLIEATETRPQVNYVTVDLPEGQTYRAGDYLAVLPKNPPPAVDRVLKLFKLAADDSVIVNIPGSFLPADTPMRADDLFASYVELGQPASKRILPALIEYCKDPAGKDKLRALEDEYADEVLDKRRSLLDLIEMTAADVPLEFFLANLPKMKIRQYSTSSTPLDDPTKVTLTYTVHAAPASSGHKYLGVASNYLAFLNAGDSLLCAVKASADFHLPADPKTPVVMFAAGSGIAPFRGFISERALQRAAGRTVGATVLYFGTRTAEDVLHSEEMMEWIKDGTLDFRPVLSRTDDTTLPDFPDSVTLVQGTSYVQDRVWEERDDIQRLFFDGAQFYTCGSGARLGVGLKAKLVDIIAEVQGCDTEEAAEIMDKLSRERYKTDVFL